MSPSGDKKAEGAWKKGIEKPFELMIHNVALRRLRFPLLLKLKSLYFSFSFINKGNRNRLHAKLADFSR